MVRQHVNPLSSFHQRPLLLPPPAELFADPRRPIHLDIGCARGRFLLAMAAAEPARNYLGVEIRRPLVAAAEAERQALGLAHLRFLFCNANVSLEQWLAGLKPGQLERVSLQFPDPWFKTRHHKRRVLQPTLLGALAAAQEPAGELFLQSDVLAVIAPMVALVEASGGFDRATLGPELESGHEAETGSEAPPWQGANPLPVPSEREAHVRRLGLPVYRVLYRRNRRPLTALATLEQGAARPTEPSRQAADTGA